MSSSSPSLAMSIFLKSSWWWKSGLFLFQIIIGLYPHISKVIRHAMQGLPSPLEESSAPVKIHVNIHSSLTTSSQAITTSTWLIHNDCYPAHSLNNLYNWLFALAEASNCKVISRKLPFGLLTNCWHEHSCICQRNISFGMEPTSFTHIKSPTQSHANNSFDRHPATYLPNVLFTRIFCPNHNFGITLLTAVISWKY